MFLATYIGIRPGLQGLGNIAIRLRLNTKYTHSEIVFEPGDDVDHLMPDFKTQPDENGALWAASSVFAERIPKDSLRRPGEVGGVRFKRINTNTPDWECVKFDADPKQMAEWFCKNQGIRYDYSLIASYAVWPFTWLERFYYWVLRRKKPDRALCSETIAAGAGMPEAERIDPAVLHNLALMLKQRKDQLTAVKE